MKVITTIKFTSNEKVLNEMKAIEKTRDELNKLINRVDSLEEYLNPFLTSVNGKEFVKRCQFQSKLMILDIGFGRGESSLYLASLGHIVISLEPSGLNCEILQRLSEKFRLKIKIYQAVAETIDQIEEDGFDACIFNSSLHHCDDPGKAIFLCKEKLKKNGKVLAMNEPILKCYQTKKWYFRKMEENPVSIGHYGGNEHIYSYREYIKMFKAANFKDINSYLHTRLEDPRMTIFQDFNRKIDGKFIHSNGKLLMKFMILLFIYKCLRKNFFARLLLNFGKRLSLLPMTFEANFF